MGWFIVVIMLFGFCFTLWANNKLWAERFVFKPLGWIGLGMGLCFVGIGILSGIYSLMVRSAIELERALWMVGAGVSILVFVGINVVSEKNNMKRKKEI